MPGTKRIGYSHSALTAGFVVSLPRNNSRSRGVREALPSERAGGRYESGTNRTEVRTGPGLASERFGDGGARRGRAHLRRRAGENACLHDELVWRDDTPDGKQSRAVWRCEAGLRVRPARKS